jgi:nitrite reductase (NAD(P)H)
VESDLGKDGKKANEDWIEPDAKDIPDKVEEKQNGDVLAEEGERQRKKIVVVGLGMVGIAFM